MSTCVVDLVFDSNKQKLWILSVVKELLIEAGPSAILSSLRKAYPDMAVEGNKGFAAILSDFGRGNIDVVDIEYEWNCLDWKYFRTTNNGVQAAEPLLNASNGTIRIDVAYAESQSPGMLANDIVCLLGLYLYSSCTGDRRDAYQAARDSRFSFALAEHSPKLSQLLSFLREADDSRSSRSDIAEHEWRSTNRSQVGLSASANYQIENVLPQNSAPRRPSIAGWLATILGLYLVATGVYTITQIFKPLDGSSDSLSQTSKFLSDYGLLEENAPVTIVASYVVGAPIFFGVTMMAVGSIARRRR